MLFRVPTLLRLIVVTILAVVCAFADTGESILARGKLRGATAIQALGKQMDGVALRHGFAPHELQRMFRHDHSLLIDKDKRLYYEEPALVANSALVESQALTAHTIVLADTFRLHSKPGSKRRIFLDFDGHVITNSVWNSDFHSNSFTAPPWDTEGGPSVFTDSEKTNIQTIWQRVAEDYAAFDVDVTTEDQGEDLLTRSSSSDEYYGMRALVSPISSYFGDVGGIANIGAFADTGDRYKPALIFPERLLNGEKYVAEACSHEVGHTLGLFHDGVIGGGAYYTGHGSGETSWAPIMGFAYYSNVTQWSRGEYPNANNLQDDLAVIQANGLSYRMDDYGDSNGTATVAPAGSQFTVNGVLSSSSDVDVVSFVSAAGAINLGVTPAELGPNADLLLTLEDSSGTILATADPTDVLAANINYTVSGGTYYVHIRGTGNRDLATGYSSYASFGAYTLQGVIVGSSVPPPPVTNLRVRVP